LAKEAEGEMKEYILNRDKLFCLIEGGNEMIHLTEDQLYHLAELSVWMEPYGINEDINRAALKQRTAFLFYIFFVK